MSKYDNENIVKPSFLWNFIRVFRVFDQELYSTIESFFQPKFSSFWSRIILNDWKFLPAEIFEFLIKNYTQRLKVSSSRNFRVFDQELYSTIESFLQPKPVTLQELYVNYLTLY